jgi:alpha-N-acetylglucosaminidase
MLKTYHPLIKSKCLKITGIDINKIYLKHCIRLIKKNHLEDNLTIYHQHIESFNPPRNEFFDFVLFSMSFMLFKNQPLILEKVKNYLHSDGEIVFFQAMFKERSLLKDFIKPKLKYFTTIDFGKTIYENDFFSLLERHELTISQDRMITKGCFNGECRMIVAGQEKPYHNSTARRSSQCARNVL